MEQQLLYQCFKRLMEANIIGIAIANTQGDILEANDYYLNTLKCTREDLKAGKVRWIEMTPPEWLSADEKAIAELRERGICTPYEKEYVRKDGSRISVFISDAFLDSEKEHILALIMDITERKKIEDRLRDSEAQLSNAMKIANLGHWEYDVDRDMFIFNDNFYALFRTTAEAVGGYTMSSADYANRFIHPEDKGLVAVETRKAIETDDPHFNRQLEHRIIFPNGEIGYITVRYFIVKDSQGKTIKTYGVNQDITERKKTEEKLNESFMEAEKSRQVMISMLEDNNQIRDELVNRLEELKRTQSMLVQSAKMASLGQLAGGVAHEINNPLTGVVNNIQLIKMELEAGKEFKLKDFEELLKVIEESALRCKKITESLLGFSHASHGAYNPVDLNDIAKRVAGLISHELKLENIRIQEDLGEGIPPISGDAQLLQQVVMNLIVNASWAIQKKNSDIAGTITIKTWHDPNEKSVCLLVADTGIGIPRENIARLFEPFFTTKDVGKGTGLGLALTYNIVQSHHGTIEVESEPGKDTSFKIKLPAV